MNGSHTISRRIEIDMAHRVPDHGSKCRNLHGHRYVIEAVCSGALGEVGPERGMVLDFGFLKEEMIAAIHDPCDHAAVLWADDPLLANLAGAAAKGAAPGSRVASPFGPVLVLSFTPTAENLARYWFEALAPRVAARSGGRAQLRELRVHETPNSTATYSGAG
ncbi:MAG TPA: 6-carboxytetrahydropterin synthase [Bauldia sp.]|nr:6-carboxytetrahydropterin synthase [Bauldia sp.]